MRFLSFGSSPSYFGGCCVTLCALKMTRPAPQPGQAWRISPDLSISRTNPCFGLVPSVFFAKSGKILSASPQGGTGKCWGRDPGSLDHRVVPAGHQDWPRAKAWSCPLLLDWVELNCLFDLSLEPLILPLWGEARAWRGKESSRDFLLPSFQPFLSLCLFCIVSTFRGFFFFFVPLLLSDPLSNFYTLFMGQTHSVAHWMPGLSPGGATITGNSRNTNC